MAKHPRNDEPRRVESVAKMVVAEELPMVREKPLMDLVVDPAIPEGDTVARIVNLAPPDSVTDARGTFQTPERPYRPMTEAIQDGTLLEAIAEDGAEFMMMWRRTSRFKAGRWEPVGFWSDHLSRQPLKVEPVGWRLSEGFAMPGAVVA